MRDLLAPVIGSPTGVEGFDRCQRKWAWVKVDGLPRASNRYAAFGTRMHTELETWLLTGRAPSNEPEGLAAKAGLHLIPRPGQCRVEGEMALSIRAPDDPHGPRIPFKGKIDVVAYAGAFLDLCKAGDDPYALTVCDHKSCGNLSGRSVKTKLYLETEDLQAALYSEAVAPDVPARLRWVYYHSVKPYKAIPVDGTSYPSARLPVVQRAVDSYRRQLAIIRDPRIETALQLPPNREACGDYGGCPYRVNCTDLDAKSDFGYLMMTAVVPPHTNTKARDPMNQPPNPFMQAPAGPPGAPPPNYGPPQGGPPPAPPGAEQAAWEAFQRSQAAAPPAINPPQAGPPGAPPQGWGAPPQGPPPGGPPQGWGGAPPPAAGPPTQYGPPPAAAPPQGWGGQPPPAAGPPAASPPTTKPRRGRPPKNAATATGPTDGEDWQDIAADGCEAVAGILTRLASYFRTPF